LRILQIAPPWFPVPPSGYGGVEEVVAQLTDGLITTGHEVTLLAAGGSRSRGRLWTTFAEPPTDHLGDVGIELAHALRGHRRGREFDVIHDHTRAGAALGAMPGGPPIVHTLHGRWTPTNTILYRELARAVALVAISHDQAARTPDGIGLSGVVHNGIDVSRYPFVPDKGDHLAFLGRASPDKGPDLAIEVAKRLGRPLRMAIKVNEPDEHAYFREVLTPLIADADVELVRITSPDEKAEFLATAAAVLFPIRWPEPFGLVPLEANACGTPVVAFANGAVPEIVEDGRSGFLVAPGDLDGFRRAVERVDELLAADCRTNVAERFGAERMVRGYLRLYERLVVPPRRGVRAPAGRACERLPTLEQRTENLRIRRMTGESRVPSVTPPLGGDRCRLGSTAAHARE
jgi:glycosyltransferase involved in cell wall biosynthesis